MQLLAILFDVVGPIFLVVLAGWIWARRGAPFDPRFVTLLVTTVATPCLVIDSLANAGLSAAAFGQLALASVLCHAFALAAAYGFVRAMGGPVAAFVPVLAFPNSGNMGLPLALFAFGPAGLALAIAFYAIASLLQFTVGQSIAAGGLKPGELLRMPLVWAIIAAIGLAASGLQLPVFAGRAIHILGGLMVPLMLLSLGYSLARLKTASVGAAVAYSLARLLGGFAIGWIVASLLGLDGAARGVVVAQSAMPSAVYNYMFAERYGNRPEEVAGIVVISTLLSLAFLPAFLASVI